MEQVNNQQTSSNISTDATFTSASQKEISFQVNHQTANARAGLFIVVKKSTGPDGKVVSSTKELATPCCILSSKLGAPPNFTLDIWNKFKKTSNAVQLGFPDMYNEFESIKNFGKGIHEFIACTERHNNRTIKNKQVISEDDPSRIPETLVYLTLRDPANNNSTSTSMENSGVTDDSITVFTRSGRMKVTFKQYLEVLKSFDADIVECISMDIPYHINTKKVRKSVEVSLKWLDKCLEQKVENLFGVIQGGNSVLARQTSATETAKRNVAGFVLGSFGLGESEEQRGALVRTVISSLPANKVRVIPGIGTPNEVLQAVDLGCDIFNSNYPNVISEWGYAITFSLSDFEKSRPFKINLRNKQFQLDKSPMFVGCPCYTCKMHTRAYIHHLLNTHEMLANVLLTIHNCWHYLEFFTAIRESITKGAFHEFKKEYLKVYYPEVPQPTNGLSSPRIEQESKRVKVE